MTGTHKDITKVAFENSKSVLQSDIPDFSRIINDMGERIVWGNASQDYLHLLDHRRHYSYTGDRIPEVVAGEYTRYLEAKTKNFNSALNKPNVNNCANALKLLGRLSHSWQDYYGHGVLNDPSLSIEDRRDIFSKSGTNMGTPDNRGDLYPSSWSWNPFNANTEHPSLGRGEPALPGTANYYARYDASVGFTSGKFRGMLPVYWEHCKCFAKELLDLGLSKETD